MRNTHTRTIRRFAIATLLPAALLVSPTASGQQFPASIEAVELPGPILGDNAGKSVSGVGDVNGDGIDDVAVGAPYVDTLACAGGAVFIYFGGSSFFDTTPDVTLGDGVADDQFGISVTGGMDLNNDGFDDIAAGARFNDTGTTDGGAVFIFLGGASISTTPSLGLFAEASNDWFGQSVSNAGDVNGDGFDDLVVGAPYNDAVANAAGRAYVYFGGDPMDNTVDVFLEGAAQSNAHFGWSVAGAGDVNNDGFTDVIVGARLHGSGLSSATGRAYIFFGGPSMDGVADVILDGEARNDWFGESVGGAGDVNADGFDDVVVGAHFNDANGSASGEASIFFGGNPMDTTSDVEFAGPHMDAQLGNAVAGAGDVDANGYDDVIVGAHFANAAAGTAAGTVFLLRGAATVAGFDHLEFTGAAAHDQFGESVSGAGRVAAVGQPAFLIGAHYNDTNGVGAGMAYNARPTAAAGDVNDDGTVNVTDLLALLGDWGSCVSCPTDINGDGAVNVTDLLALLGGWGP